MRSSAGEPRATHTDGPKPYLPVVEDAFGGDVDYSMLVKLYGASGKNETRYSAAKLPRVLSDARTGDPDPKHISTSYVERQNLTMRISMQRFSSDERVLENTGGPRGLPSL